MPYDNNDPRGHLEITLLDGGPSVCPHNIRIHLGDAPFKIETDQTPNGFELVVGDQVLLVRTNCGWRH